jgi:hypothetical protein
MERSPFEPLTLFRSFMTVVSGFVLSQIVYFGLRFLLGYLFFPDFLAFFQLDEAEQQKQVAENLHGVIPLPMFIAHIFLCLIAFWFVGWLAAAVAPLAHFQHGLLIAILVFVWFLQSFVADPPSKKWMDFIQMILLPTAILFGAKRASDAFLSDQHE